MPKTKWLRVRSKNIKPYTEADTKGISGVSFHPAMYNNGKEFKVQYHKGLDSYFGDNDWNYVKEWLIFLDDEKQMFNFEKDE